MGKYSAEYIKARTNELYDSLPMDYDSRIKCFDIRDEILDLNYTFFGYVASSTFVEGVEYEDKFQTAIMSFLGMWWKYKWTPKYRADLSFAVFFKPRISEEIKRYLSVVSYTQRRTACSKAAKQLGKHWTKVTYEDLSKVTLPAEDMIALKAVLGANIPADISELDTFLESKEPVQGIEKYQTTKYDSIEELLIQEMIERESKLSDKDLKDIADMYSLPHETVTAAYPKSLDILYKRLSDNLDI